MGAIAAASNAASRLDCNRRSWARRGLAIDPGKLGLGGGPLV